MAGLEEIQELQMVVRCLHIKAVVWVQSPVVAAFLLSNTVALGSLTPHKMGFRSFSVLPGTCLGEKVGETDKWPPHFITL